MRRGQITAFIIIGIVALFSVGFTIYLINTISSNSAKINVQKQSTGVHSCVESAAAAAILQMGAQGGTDGGQAMINGGAMQIGIKAYEDLGYVNLQPLCLAGGPNRPGIDLSRTCLSATYQTTEPDASVIQNYLDRTIQTNIKYCGVQSKVTVIYGGDDVSIITDNVSVQLPFRLKRVFNLAFAVAQMDTSDVSFDKRTVTSLGGCDGQFGECVFPLMFVTSQRVNGDYSIVRITDTAANHIIGGKPFVFQYAVEDRPPAFTDYPSTTWHYYSDTGDNKYVTVSVADPDEDEITVSCSTPAGLTVDCNTGQTVNGIGPHVITLLGGSGEVTVTATANNKPTSISFQVQDLATIV